MSLELLSKNLSKFSKGQYDIITFVEFGIFIFLSFDYYLTYNKFEFKFVIFIMSAD